MEKFDQGLGIYRYLGFKVKGSKFRVLRFAELSRAGVRAAPHKVVGRPSTPRRALARLVYHPYRPRLFSFRVQGFLLRRVLQFRV